MYKWGRGDVLHTELDPPFSSPSCTVCVESICSALTEMVVSQQEAARNLQIMLGVNWMVLLIQYTCTCICTMQVLETGYVWKNIKTEQSNICFPHAELHI